MARAAITILLMAAVYAGASEALGMERFPPPEFTQGRKLPGTATPAPRADVFAYLDVLALAAALGMAAWLTLAKRSRRGVFLLMVFSLLYFGFWRRGCVCSVGSTQDVALAVFNSGYAVPLTVLLFFLLPLLFALVAGRVFCSSVCPLGAAQDLVLFRPLTVPAWLEHALGLLPSVYLGAAVLLAACGSAFIVCQYDPFVAFFRFSGGITVLILGAAFLAISMFIGRAYCRFVCPYSVLLNLAARLSHWRVKITPDDCVQCRLCEDACPFGAIRKPSLAGVFARTEGRGRLAVLILLLPVLVAGLGWLGHSSGAGLARTNATVRLAELVRQDAGRTSGDPVNEVVAFIRTGRTNDELYRDAGRLREKYRQAGWILGGWVGLVIGAKLIRLSVRRTRKDYEADRGACLACARCYTACPRERLRIKKASNAL